MATKLFFRAATGSDYGTGNNDANLRGTATAWQPLLLSTAQGSSAIAVNTNTIAGPTAGVETQAASAAALVWYSAPLDADVTISGSITWNLWAAESNMSAEAAINGQIEVIDGATGSITLIDKTARTTEMAVAVAPSETVNNFSETPASGVACKRGDRLRVRVFADDVTTMASTFQFSFAYAGATGVRGDSWLELTENLTFVSEPAATTIYPTDTASAVSTASVDREAWTSRGAGVQTDVVNTATGFTAPIQVTDTAGGTVVDWFTRPLAAFTLGGAVRVNARALESATSANAAIRCEIARVASDGTGATVWGATSFPVELTASEAAQSFLVSGDDLAVSDGQRLRIRFSIDDPQPAVSAAMASGQTVTLYYAGTSGGASGDTYLTFTQTLTEYSAGGSTTVTPTTATLTTAAFAPTAALGQILTPNPGRLILGGALTTLASDTFTRSVTDGWGSADVGGSWTLTGTAANFDVNGSAATIVQAAGTGGSAHLPSVSTVDSDQTYTFSVASLVTGGSAQQIQLHSRVVSESSAEHYRAIAFVGGAGQVTLQVQKRVAGSEVSITGDSPVGFLTGVVADEPLKLRFQTLGASPTAVRAKVWRASADEPSWQLDTTDSESSLQATNPLGLRFFNGGTSGAGTVTLDNYSATNVIGSAPPTVTVAVATVVIPTTRALALATFAPTVSTPQTVTPTTTATSTTTFAPVLKLVVTPTTAATTTATFAPAVAATNHQLVTPTTASLATATFAPTITAGASQTVTPTTLAAALATFAPTVTAGATTVVIPTTATLTTAAFAPALRLTVIPTTAATTTTTFAPQLRLVVTPTTTATATATFAPRLVTTVTPAVTATALATFAPTVSASAHQVATPTTASLATATFAATVSATLHQTVTPTTAALVATTQAPSVTTGNNREAVPNPISVTLATFAPTVTGAANVTVTPTTAALATAVFAPSVATTAHQLLTPTTAALAMAIFTPAVTVGDVKTVTPTTAALSLAVFAPTVTAVAATTVTPTTAALTATRYVPVIDLRVTPTTLATTTARFAPVITFGINVTPTTRALVTTALAPAVAATTHQFLTPPTLALTLVTYAPGVSNVSSGYGNAGLWIREVTDARMTLTVSAATPTIRAGPDAKMMLSGSAATPHNGPASNRPEIVEVR